jgi:hypothetical protein
MIIDQFENGIMTDGIDWKRSTTDTVRAFHEIMNNFVHYKEKAVKANASYSLTLMNTMHSCKHSRKK